MQGMGWLTTEELVFHTDGRLLTHAPSTYKIPVRVGCAGALQDHAVGRREPRGHDLSLQGGRRAAADAGDLGVRGDRRRDPQPQPGDAGAARRAGDAGVDPACRAGGDEPADVRPGRPSRASSRRMAGRAGDARAGARLEPARGRRPHGGGAGRHVHRHDRRRRAGMGRARRSAGAARAARWRAVDAARQGARARSRPVLRRARAADDRAVRRGRRAMVAPLAEAEQREGVVDDDRDGRRRRPAGAPRRAGNEGRSPRPAYDVQPDGRVLRALRRGADARSICSAPAMSDARSASRWRRCRSLVTWIDARPGAIPRDVPGQCHGDHAGRSGRTARAARRTAPSSRS